MLYAIINVMLVKKFSVVRSSSGYKMLISLPKELAEYFKREGGVVVFIFDQHKFKDFLINTYYKGAKAKEIPLEEVIHKILAEAMKKELLELLGLK